MASEIFNNILKQAKKQHTSLGDISKKDEQETGSENSLDDNISQKLPDVNKETLDSTENARTFNSEREKKSEMKSDKKAKNKIQKIDTIITKGEDKDTSKTKEQDQGNSEIKEQNIDVTTKKEDDQDTSRTKKQEPDSSTTKEQDHDNNETKEQNIDNTQTKEQQAAGKITSVDYNKRKMEAKRIIKNRMIASVAAGLIPFPVIDIATLTGIQMDTVRVLSKLYNVDFTKNFGRTAISSFTGGILPVATGRVVNSAVKMVPIVGQFIGAVSMPVIAGASTYALGKVFVQHFESGGTFLTLDPEKVRGYFNEEYIKGQNIAESELNK